MCDPLIATFHERYKITNSNTVKYLHMSPIIIFIAVVIFILINVAVP